MSTSQAQTPPDSGEDADPLDLLLVASAGGDRQSFKQLFEAMAPRLNALLRSMAIAAADAEDLLVEVFYKAWCQAHRFDPQRGRARTWLAVIARRHALDHLRSRQRRRDAELAARQGALEEQPAALGPLELEASAETSQRLQALLAQLPREQQEAIRVVFFDGLSHSEAAARLQQPLGTIKSRIRSALSELRRHPSSALESPR